MGGPHERGKQGWPWGRVKGTFSGLGCPPTHLTLLTLPHPSPHFLFSFPHLASPASSAPPATWDAATQNSLPAPLGVTNPASSSTVSAAIASPLADPSDPHLGPCQTPWGPLWKHAEPQTPHHCCSHRGASYSVEDLVPSLLLYWILSTRKVDVWLIWADPGHLVVYLSWTIPMGEGDGILPAISGNKGCHSHQ